MNTHVICRKKDEDTNKWQIILLRGSEPFNGMIKTGRILGQFEEFCYPEDLDELLNSTNLK